MIGRRLIDRPTPGWTRVSSKSCEPRLISALREHCIFEMFDRVPVSIEGQPIIRLKGDEESVTFYSSGWRVKLGRDNQLPNSDLEFNYVSDRLVPDRVIAAPGVVWELSSGDVDSGSAVDIVCKVAGSCPVLIDGLGLFVSDHHSYGDLGLSYGDEPVVAGLKFSKLAGWEWISGEGSLALVEFFSASCVDDLKTIVDEVIANLDRAQAELAGR